MNSAKYFLTFLTMAFYIGFVLADEREHGHDDHGHDEHVHAGHSHGEHGHDHEHDHGGQPHGEHDHGLGPEVQVSVSAQRLIGVKTVKVSERRIESSIDLRGRFALTPSARLAAVSPVAGTVAFQVRARQKVRKGDVLFTVSSTDLRARTAEIAVLERRLAGYVQSGARNAGLQSELDLRRAERAALVGSAIEAGGVVTVRSEIDGIVTSLAVSAGASVETGGTVVELVNPNELCLVAKIPAGDRARLASGQPVILDGHKGTLELDVTDPSEVRVVFADLDPAWRVGDYAKATCVTATVEKPSLVVPSASVVQVGVSPVVFMRAEGEDDHFIAFAAEVGRQADGWTEILNLPDDDAEVVVCGQYELKLALAASTGDRSKKSVHFHADGTVHEGDD